MAHDPRTPRVGQYEEPEPPRGVNRRGFLAGLGATAMLAQSALHAPEAEARPDTRPRGDLDLVEGTDLAAQISPNGRRIAMDLVGVLWVMPSSGGQARRLTSDLFDIAQPEWSRDNETLAFQSYRDGVFNLWTIRADGSHLKQLTKGPYDHREPRWSPDGRRLVFSSDLNGSYGIYTYDFATANIAVVSDTAEEEYEPAWSPDGTKIAFVVSNTRIDMVDLATGLRSTLLTVPTGQVIHQPAWTPDSKDVVYNLLHDGKSDLYLSGSPLVNDEETFPFRVSWLDDNRFVYTADGKIRRRSLNGAYVSSVGFIASVGLKLPHYRKRRRDFASRHPQKVRGIGSPVLSPDGKQVAFRALNDIYTMDIGGRPRPLTRDHWWKQDPVWSPDGRYLAYSTDRTGTLNIWIRDLNDGSDRQLTNLPDAAALSSAWSHDGNEIAFLDQEGALYTVVVDSGDVQRVFPATFEPGRPTWSADGKVIALSAIKPYSARYREGLSKILLVNRHTGKATYVDPLANRSIQTRGDDGPVWSPDGSTMAFAVASVLYVMDVEADGTPAGPARQITDEVTDAPSWSGDSKELLYLNNARLRMVSAEGGLSRTVAVPLTWTNIRPRGRIVIQAGEMWDGSSIRLRRDVDIVVEGQRITAVEGRKAGRDSTVIDARDSVVIPGLIDMHHHREMAGYAYGDRQGRLWLSLGITTTRSPGSPAYHMVEDRESVQSGARIAPRYFGTGEAVDGARIYYNFMRPTFDEPQLELEFERAAALDYDLMKAYVRLPVAWQKRLIEFAHRRHIHATSHYHYPALTMAGDGMEHIGATNRFGYSRTVTALGTGYSDVIDIFDATKAVRAPTLFGATTLYREDTSLVNDRRVRTLYPSWEYAKLQAAATLAKTTDQTVARENLRRQVRQLVDVVRGGGRIITGTDSPIANNVVSTHMNLRAMVRYGLTPHEAMVTATSEPGRFLNEPIGRIEPGMFADISVLGGNPLDDITQAANVEHVIVAGVAHTVDQLLAPFEKRGPHSAAPNNTMLAPVPQPISNKRFWWHDPRYVEEARHSCCTG